MPVKVAIAIALNIGLSLMGAYYWLNEHNVDTKEFVIFASITFIPLYNIYVHVKSRRTNPDSEAGLLAIYLRRRKLEEMKRVRQLEKET